MPDLVPVDRTETIALAKVAKKRRLDRVQEELVGLGHVRSTSGAVGMCLSGLGVLSLVTLPWWIGLGLSAVGVAFIFHRHLSSKRIHELERDEAWLICQGEDNDG